MTSYFRLLFCLLVMLASQMAFPAVANWQLVTTEADPDATVNHCVNAINGRYCECATDLTVTAPDALILQRFYTNVSYVNGTGPGEWRFIPQCFLVLGRNPTGRTKSVGKERMDWTLALAGERSGGILPYSGWRSQTGSTKFPMMIDVLGDTKGMVNAYAGEISGQTNHANNILTCSKDTCELLLGDGTKRLFRRRDIQPNHPLLGNLLCDMAAQVVDPDFYLLVTEKLPSGNIIEYTYDDSGQLTSIELQCSDKSSVLAWIHFTYVQEDLTYKITALASDAKSVDYHFQQKDGRFDLVSVHGSHLIPIDYTYSGALTQKSMPEGRTLLINYDDQQRVQSLDHSDGLLYSFNYEPCKTTVKDAMGHQRCFLYDTRLQLTCVECYDDNHKLYRSDHRYYGTTKQTAGWLQARSVADGTGRVHSYRLLKYDDHGNVVERRLYGNLTGKGEVDLKVDSAGTLVNADDEECHVSSYEYSKDGLNLLTRVGDCKGNKTLYLYHPGTNLLVRKFIYDGSSIKRRTFNSYDKHAIRIKSVEDDGSQEDESKIHGWSTTERHIVETTPKLDLPGVGLPLVIEERALDMNQRKEVLVRRVVNTYDAQANLTSCSTYDADDVLAYTEQFTYGDDGRLLSHINRNGLETRLTYDAFGNVISASTPHDGRRITTQYNVFNQPLVVQTTTSEGKLSVSNAYDALGRKTSTVDRYGNATDFIYDGLGRLVRVLYPQVLDESEQPVRPTYTYAYDLFGNAIVMTDPKGYVTKKSYNLHGDVTNVYHPDGTFEMFKYDTEGSLHRSLTRDQIITVHEYDYLGRAVYEESSLADEKGISAYYKSRAYKYSGFRLREDKEDEHTMSYRHDSVGRLACQVEYRTSDAFNEPSARRTDIVYDSMGRVKERKVWFDAGPQDYSLECFSYDKSDHVLQKILKDHQGSVLLNRKYLYDFDGRCLEEYDDTDGKRQSIIRTEYNSSGEIIRLIDGLEGETCIFIDHAHRNGMGQTVCHKILVNPIGVQTRIEYDALGRIHSTSKIDPLGVLLSKQQVYYDASGNKAKENTYQVLDGAITSLQTTIWKYGPLGHLEEEVLAAQTPEEQRTQYQYNSIGKLASKTVQGLSEPIKYSYGKDGYLNKVEAPGKITLRYAHNKFGNIREASSSNGITVERTYNYFQQVSQETIKDGLVNTTVKYKYDRIGRVKEITLPDSSRIAYNYNAAFGTSVARIAANGSERYRHTYDGYDSQGRLTTETYIGYLGVQEHSYDASGRSIGISGEFYTDEFRRDLLGRIIETIGSEDCVQYTYNGLSQVVKESGQDSQHTYAYDSVDNRMSKDQDRLVHNSRNQLLAASNAQYSYDPQGNLVKKVVQGKETLLEANALCQINRIQSPDGPFSTYAYDPFGRLISQKNFTKGSQGKTPTSGLRFFYVGYQELGTIADGRIQTLQIPGVKGNALSQQSVAFELGSALYVPQYDIRGNVIAIWDPIRCDAIETYAYTVFGEERIYGSSGKLQSRSNEGNPWRFAGKRVDSATGLVLFGFRFYDPSMGRWITADPAGALDGPNRYAYLHNNPLNLMDRFGLASESDSASKFNNYFYGEVETHCFCEKHRTCKRGGDLHSTSGFSLPSILYAISPEMHMMAQLAFGPVNVRHFNAFEDLPLNTLLFGANPFTFGLDFRKSQRFDLKDLGLVDRPNLRIGWCCGVGNTLDCAWGSAIYISKMAEGVNVHGVHNVSRGAFVDLFEAVLNMFHVATPPVRLLHEMWDDFLLNSVSDARFLMICHSQGALHVRNALMDYSPELRKRIIVVAIAPAGYIDDQFCYRATHYRVAPSGDIVPYLDYNGWSGESGSIVQLQSHPDAGFIDHSFQSPTYERSLSDELSVYLRGE